jgi:hypothetical protein
MRKLKRAYLKKQRKRFRYKALTAGTAAAITLGTGAGIHKAFAGNTEPAPDGHQIAVSQDSDSDLLADTEEFSIGYQPFNSDQNKNEMQDGVELAIHLAAIIDELPIYIPGTKMPIPNEAYKIEHLMYGLEKCDICGENVNMGGIEIVNPRINMTFPDPNDPLDGQLLPELAIHYMRHGSFDCLGDIHSGRVDISRLLRVLEVRFPYSPDKHQLPIDDNDTDNDLLTDDEELTSGYNLHDADQNDNLIPDGVDLAKQCVEVIDSLPEVDPNGPEIAYMIYKESFMMRGLENCDICSKSVNMGYWQVTNSRLGQSIEVPEIVLHYMEHGSFNYAGDVHGTGRIDVSLLKKILEMPQRCGDLGTIYKPADVNKDCRVDSNDLVEYIEKWVEQSDSDSD